MSGQLSGRHRRRGPASLHRLRGRINAVTGGGRSQLLAGGVALGSALGIAVSSLLGRRLQEASSQEEGRHAEPSLKIGPLDSAAVTRNAPLTQEVTGERLLAAWRDSATGSATTIGDLPDDSALDSAPVRLLGEMNGFSFWVGADSDSPLVLRVQAVWDRTLPPESIDPLRRAINDWNRDHVWPLVWLIASHTGHTVGASASMDLAHGATHQQLVDFLDVSLAAIDNFFTALDDATPPTDANEDPEVTGPDRL